MVSNDEWLSPDFDATKLTTAALASLLSRNEVAVPQNSRTKKALLELYETHLAPKGADIIAETQRQAAKPRGGKKGAASAPAGSGSSSTGLRAVTPPGMKQTGRERSKARATAAEEPAAAKTAGAKRKKPVAEPDEPEEQEDEHLAGLTSPAKRARKEPAAKVEEDATHFSDDNPFQSPESKKPGAKGPLRKTPHPGRVKKETISAPAAVVPMEEDEDPSFAGARGRKKPVAAAGRSKRAVTIKEDVEMEEAAPEPEQEPEPEAPAPSRRPAALPKAVANLRGQPKASSAAASQGPSTVPTSDFTFTPPAAPPRSYMAWTPESPAVNLSPDPAKTPYVIPGEVPVIRSPPAVETPIRRVTMDEDVDPSFAGGKRRPSPQRPIIVEQPPQVPVIPVRLPVAPAPAPAQAPPVWVPEPPKPVGVSQPVIPPVEPLTRRSRVAFERAQDQPAIRNPVLNEFKQQQEAIPQFKEKLSALGPGRKPAVSTQPALLGGSSSSGGLPSAGPVSATVKKTLSVGPEKPQRKETATSEDEAAPSRYRGALGALFAVLLGTSGMLSADWYRNTFQGFETNLPAGLPPPQAEVAPTGTANAWSKSNPLRKVLPSVIACPDDSVCERQAVVACAPNYVQEPTLLQKVVPKALLPFPLDQPRCVLDTQKIDAEKRRERVLRWLEDRTERAARVHAGKVACGELKPSLSLSNSASSKPVQGMPVATAWETVKGNAQGGRKGFARAGSDQVEWTELEQRWNEFVDLLGQQGKPVTGSQDNDTQPVWFPNLSLVRGKQVGITTSAAPIISWTCWATRVAHMVVPAILALVLVTFMCQRQVDKMKRSSLEDELAADLCAWTLDNLRASPEAISVLQLRDHFLTSTKPPRVSSADDFPQNANGAYYVGTAQDVRRIWNKVRSMIDKNSNVRTLDVMIAGEPHESWQWIGLRDLTRSPTTNSPAVYGTPGQVGYQEMAAESPLQQQGGARHSWVTGQERPVY